MRKLTLVLAVVMMLLFVACGGNESSATPENPGASKEETVAELTAGPTVEPTAELTPEPKTEYYEQLSQLPTLDSVTGVRETGKNSFTSNGRYTSIKYYYESPTTEQMEQYEKSLSETGFRMEKDGDEYLIYLEKISVATITLENGKATVDISPDAITILNMEATEELHIGDVKTVEGKSDIQLLDVYYTDKVKVKEGNITHTHGTVGKYYLVLKTNLTNKKSTDFDRWNSGRLTDISAMLDSQYIYKGEYWAPKGDIVPLTDGDVYIIYEVPESVETGEQSFVAYFKLDGVYYSVTIR